MNSNFVGIQRLEITLFRTDGRLSDRIQFKIQSNRRVSLSGSNLNPIRLLLGENSLTFAVFFMRNNLFSLGT